MYWNDTKMRIPMELRCKVQSVSRDPEGWYILLVPGYYSRTCHARHIIADTQREALSYLRMAQVETFQEEDGEGRVVAQGLTVEQVRERYPNLPKGHKIKSSLTKEPAVCAIPGLRDWSDLDL